MLRILVVEFVDNAIHWINHHPLARFAGLSLRKNGDYLKSTIHWITQFVSVVLSDGIMIYPVE